MRPTNAAGLSAVVACVALAACAGADLKPVASLSAANMMAPSGYSETKVSDTQYLVQATGTEATPKARIEKIARARAAQIAVEQKMKFYKVSSVQFGVACTKGHEFYKGGQTHRRLPADGEARRRLCQGSGRPHLCQRQGELRRP